MESHSHCTYCGAVFATSQAWPRQCGSCTNTNYLNPFPVGVGLIPIDDGLLSICRAIDPGKDQLALPGGFIEWGETWQQAISREIFEETKLRVDPKKIEDFCVLSSQTGDGILLIFGLVRTELSIRDLPTFSPTVETSDIVIIDKPEAMAFPLHEEAVNRYFARVSG